MAPNGIACAAQNRDGDEREVNAAEELQPWISGRPTETQAIDSSPIGDPAPPPFFPFPTVTF